MTEAGHQFSNSRSGPVRFAIWSDRLPAADVLRDRLQELGQTAAASGKGDCPGECLVILTQNPSLSSFELSTLLRLANQARIHLAARAGTNRVDRRETWPSAPALTWSGEIEDLGTFAKSLINLLRPSVLRFASLPTLYPVRQPLPGVRVATSLETLGESLASEYPRVVPVSGELMDALQRATPAASRHDYDLSRLARWSSSQHRRTLIIPRIGWPKEVSSPPAGNRTLEEVVHDARTRRLVLLLGEPGSGKTEQLRYFVKPRV